MYSKTGHVLLVENADATAANFKASNGFPTSFEVCQPRGRRMLKPSEGKTAYA